MKHPLRRFFRAATWLLLLSACPSELLAEGYLYRLHLTDKAGSSYCELTERALQRRERQSVALDSTDLSISPAYLAALAEKGWQLVTRSRWLNTVVVKRPDGGAISAADFDAIAFVSRVDTIDAPLPESGGDGLAASMRLATASATGRSKWQLEEQTASATEGDNFRKPVLEVHGEVLYNAGLRGEGMLIAVIDEAFSNLPNLPFLFDKVVGWYDCYAKPETDSDGIFGSGTHGTNVLSCMATDTAYGVWGTATDARYFIIRSEYAATETQLEEDMWVFAAEMADSIGADLINSSLGYHSFDNPATDHTWAQLGQNEVQVSRGAAIAARKGMLLCISAGNDRDQQWQKIGFPGDVAEVFTVGAVMADSVPSSFSSAGWTTPNVKPDVACRGTRSWVINAATGLPRTGSGTSFASPTMCGLMASLWGANTSLQPSELCRIVRESASKAATPDSLMGYGMPDFAKALAVVNPELSLRGFLSDGDAICSRSASADDGARCYDLWGRPVGPSDKNGWQIVNGRMVMRRE